MKQKKVKSNLISYGRVKSRGPVILWDFNRLLLKSIFGALKGCYVIAKFQRPFCLLFRKILRPAFVWIRALKPEVFTAFRRLPFSVCLDISFAFCSVIKKSIAYKIKNLRHKQVERPFNCALFNFFFLTKLGYNIIYKKRQK